MIHRANRLRPLVDELYARTRKAAATPPPPPPPPAITTVEQGGVALPFELAVNFSPTDFVVANNVGNGSNDVRLRNPPLAGGTNLLDIFANRPAAGTANGQVFYTKDGPISFVWDSVLAVWRPLIGTTASFLSPPTVASGVWTLYEAGGRATTFVDSFGTLLLKCTNGTNGEDIRSFYTALPAAHYTFTANVVVGVPENTATMQCGLALRQSSNGFVEVFTKRTDSTGNATFARHQATANNTTTSPTYTFSAEVTSSVDWAHNTSLGFWIQVQDDGTNRTMRTSDNGFDWIDLFTEGSGTFLTPDEFGFCIFSSNAGPTTAITRVNAMTITTP